MKKFQFLCNNHRDWLTLNPSAALNTSLQAYSQSLSLAEEYAYPQAINHAGAAYEASLIVLNSRTSETGNTVERFTDASVLLARLLYITGESKFAGSVLAAAIARLERLLLLGSMQKIVLTSCERLFDIEGTYNAASTHGASCLYSSSVTRELH